MNIRLAAASGAAMAAFCMTAAAEDSAVIQPLMVVDQITVFGERFDYGAGATTTATKTDTLLRDVPQSISVISKDLIEDQAMRSMADAVQYVPGVIMGQGEGHRDAPTLRGNATTADFYIDGVRDDVQYYRDLYNVERIEVLKGPNAMIFGRGGGGGVINRVTRKADFETTGEIVLQGGSFSSWRGAGDLGAPLSDAFAVRVTGFYENSESYRDFVELERYAFNPTAAAKLGAATMLRASFEHFSDERTVDRGVPSRNGLPVTVDRSAFFGNPDESFTTTEVNRGAVTFEHEFSDVVRLRNHTSYADYDKYYQNVHAGGPADAAGDVALQAYYSSTGRENIFNQTDLVIEANTGSIGHTLLFGAELGRQLTDNLRSENNNAAGIVNLAVPTTFAPAVFAGLRTDNRVRLNLAGVYFQDQVDLTDRLQLIGGVRFDHFDLEVEDELPGGVARSRTDNVVSPRGGIVFKPIENASLYASYSVSFLPQSGDQFGSLSATSEALEPERFENIEAGFKWDFASGLAFTAAVYRLDRDRTTAIDPVTSLTVLTGRQRSKGFEIGLAGSITKNWEIAGGYAWQDAEITSDTTSAPAGRVIPLTPKHALSLWNAYHFTPRLGAGVGVIHRSDSFASISNVVTLPSYTRVDAALYFAVTDDIEAQLHVENLIDETYWGTAHNDNNITPGGPRAFRASLTGSF